MADVDVEKAQRLAKLALIAVVVSVIVLAIDYRLKNFIVVKGTEALRLLARAEELAEEARSGAARANGRGAVDSARVGGGDGVGDDAAAGATVVQSANGSGPAKGRRPAGTAGGARGDGPGTKRE